METDLVFAHGGTLCFVDLGSGILAIDVFAADVGWRVGIRPIDHEGGVRRRGWIGRSKHATVDRVRDFPSLFLLHCSSSTSGLVRVSARD